jgi:hypothetical protein
MTNLHDEPKLENIRALGLDQLLRHTSALGQLLLCSELKE